MIEAFVITLREGIEAALVVCLILSFLRKSNQTALARPVYWGLGLALILSVGAAIAVQFSGFSLEGKWEGIMLLASALLVGWMVVWMMIHGRKMKQATEARLGEILGRPSGGQKIGLFLFTFLMVFREGVETVIFLSAVKLTTSNAVLALVAGLAGTGVAVAFGIAFLKGSLRVDLRRFFFVTTIVLFIFVVQLILAGLHEFAEAGILPATETYMRIAGPLIRNNVLFILAVLALPFVLLIGSALKTASNGPVPANPAEERKRRAQTRTERAARVVFSVLAIVCIVALGGHYVYGKRELALTTPTLLKPAGGVVRIPTAELEEMKMRRFGVFMDGVVVRFLAMRVEKDKFATGLDACDICGDFGYAQLGENLLCLNCVAEIPAKTLGDGQGCNPIALTSEVHEGWLEVKVADLAQQRNRFEHSKANILVTCPGCQMQFRTDEAGGWVNGIPYCSMGSPSCRDAASQVAH